VSESRLFPSFWLAGFESACHVNRRGERLDLVRATQHDLQIREDYARVRALGLLAVRESVRWHLIDRGGHLDFSTVAPVVAAARAEGLRVLWTLCHYGWPDDVDLFGGAFVERFARYAAGLARVVSDSGEAEPWYNPINEISFFAWAAAEVGYIHPHAVGRGAELKRQLVRASLAAMDAIREVDPRARFLHVDPLIHVVTPRGRPDLARAAADQRASQFDAWDMLAGGHCSELGGHPRYLDVMGLNFYHANEWEYPDRRLRWEDTPRDPRWVPLRRLLAEVYHRYGRPLVLSETSHFGAGRARWIREVAEEAAAARAEGIPLEGVCVYPVIDRPDWDDPDHWHNSGLWDLRPGAHGRLERVACDEYVAELREVQRALEAGELAGTAGR
jgi:beta-glucosidase/6-phospho-beta-glucosidase/beta-galactosidase